VAARPRRLALSRRALIGAGAGVALVGCGTEPRPKATARRIRYGDDHRHQFADLRLPEGDPTGTLVLLHGGYWMPGYGLDQLEPIASLMTRAGWATWNVEYRPIGEGSSWPDPMTDVALAVDRLGEEHLASGVVLLGHSAGGQLAVWAASRTEQTPGGPPTVRPSGVVSLSGVLDLTRAAYAPGSSDPVVAFAGGSPPQVPTHYALSDPTLLVPSPCPVWAVHADSDQVVPRVQATSYVARARAARGRATVVDVPGDHFTLIDPQAPSFATVKELVGKARGTSGSGSR
jgi:acetyl esterase/lipase